MQRAGDHRDIAMSLLDQHGDAIGRRTAVVDRNARLVGRVVVKQLIRTPSAAKSASRELRPASASVSNRAVDLLAQQRFDGVAFAVRVVLRGDEQQAAVGARQRGFNAFDAIGEDRIR